MTAHEKQKSINFSNGILFQISLFVVIIWSILAFQMAFKTVGGPQQALEFPFGKRSTSLRAATLTRFAHLIVAKAERPSHTLPPWPRFLSAVQVAAFIDIQCYGEF